MDLSVRSTANSAVLYWDKPADALPRGQYAVLLDGRAVGTTEKTHFLLENLRPDTAYTAAVVRAGHPPVQIAVRTAAPPH